MPPRRALILITYNVRDGVDTDEYEQWLRDVDNPFFNSQPGIIRYANWKVCDAKVGTVPFRFFDLIEIPDLDAWTVFQGDAVQEFAGAWLARWSEHGADAAPETNFQLVTCEEVAAPD